MTSTPVLSLRSGMLHLMREELPNQYNTYCARAVCGALLRQYIEWQADPPRPPCHRCFPNTQEVQS